VAAVKSKAVPDADGLKCLLSTKGTLACVGFVKTPKGEDSWMNKKNVMVIKSNVHCFIIHTIHNRY